MRYALLMYLNEQEWTARAPAEEPRAIEEHGALTADLEKTGKYIACDALGSTTTSTTVRVRNGTAMVTDGPFAETKEQLVGFYLVDATDLDDALAIAARIPAARDGSVEARPVRMIDV